MAAFATVRFCAIWKIQTSVAEPEIVTPPGPIVTALPHLYTPRVSVCPVRSPVYSSVALFDRPAASVYAVSMLSTAVVKLVGVGSV